MMEALPLHRFFLRMIDPEFSSKPTGSASSRWLCLTTRSAGSRPIHGRFCRSIIFTSRTVCGGSEARQQLEIRINTCFAEVMRACAARPDTWINDEIVASYVRLHELGFAHSLETWSANELVGGLYGVAIGGAFFGESMFHHTTGASKVALWELVERLRAREFTLLDTQWLTPHLAQFGAREIPRPLYLHLLQGAIELPRTFA